MSVSFDALKDFFEKNPLCIKAAQSLKNGAEISLKVEGSSYTFTKAGGANVLKNEAATKADMSFTMPEATAADLISKSFHSVGDVGVFLFQEVASSDSSRKIHVKFHSGFLSLMASGYFGILTAGGKDVAEYLATKGFTNFNKLKSVITNLRG